MFWSQSRIRLGPALTRFAIYRLFISPDLASSTVSAPGAASPRRRNFQLKHGFAGSCKERVRCRRTSRLCPCPEPRDLRLWSSTVLDWTDGVQKNFDRCVRVGQQCIFLIGRIVGVERLMSCDCSPQHWHHSTSIRISLC